VGQTDPGIRMLVSGYGAKAIEQRHGRNPERTRRRAGGPNMSF
jgi:hypothetical protein